MSFYLSCLFAYFQHRKGIYWCPAPLRNEEECSYKVRAAADAQATPQQCIEEYISDFSVGSDDDAPTARSASPKVAATAPRRTRQTTGKMFASRVAVTITTTHMVEAKKKKRKRTEPAVSADTVTLSSRVETINIKDEKDNA
jgi:hypothetical protein